MDVSSAHRWIAEELRDLQARGRVFYETFPGAKASEARRQQGEPSRTTENAPHFPITQDRGICLTPERQPGLRSSTESWLRSATIEFAVVSIVTDWAIAVALFRQRRDKPGAIRAGNRLSTQPVFVRTMNSH